MELIDFIEKFATQFDETDVSVFTAEQKERRHHAGAG